MEQFTQQEIQNARSVVNNELQYTESYPHCLIIQNVALPDGWSKNSTDVMLIKDNAGWKVYVDGDVTSHPNGSRIQLGDTEVQGWREVTLPGITKDSLDRFIIELSEVIPVRVQVREQTQTTSQPDTRRERPVIQNVNVHVTGNTLQLEYEYRGRPAIICQEIWDISNHKVKTLDVREVQEGVVRQEWNLADDNGKEVSDGFYLLKLRTSQPEGEIFKIETIHITTRSNNNG